MNKDQKDLQSILDLAQEAAGAAYNLMSRRLDTRRNVESFILLQDAFNKLKAACDTLQDAKDKAIDKKATSSTSVMEEIMIRAGRMTMADASSETEIPHRPGVVLPFPGKK